jgi:hypothetical protein
MPSRSLKRSRSALFTSEYDIRWDLIVLLRVAQPKLG